MPHALMPPTGATVMIDIPENELLLYEGAGGT